MKPAARSAWFLWPLLLLPAVAAATLFLYPKLWTGDFAEITIESVAPTGPGEVEIRYRGRISSGTWLDTGSAWQDYTPPARFPAWPERLGGDQGPEVLRFYTIRNDQGTPATPEDLLQRIRLQVGRTYRIRPNRPLTLLRYVSFDGELVERSLRVGAYP